jgi:hypothetical protein
MSGSVSSCRISGKAGREMIEAMESDMESDGEILSLKEDGKDSSRSYYIRIDISHMPGSIELKSASEDPKRRGGCVVSIMEYYESEPVSVSFFSYRDKGNAINAVSSICGAIGADPSPIILKSMV